MTEVNGTGHVDEVHASAKHGDIYTAKSVEEIRLALSKLHQREATVTSRLKGLLASQRDFQRELGRLDLLRAQLSQQASKTRSISNGMLSSAASTANRLSGSVRQLDLEQSRVKATLEVVEQVAELKACVLGVSGSMGAPQDWETAATYLSRASKIPKEVIEGPFAAKIVPTSEVPDPPNVTLDNASESLCGLFTREFEKAVSESDGAKITRFFKLFPLIGKSEVGLDVYGRYICQGVATRSRANLNAGTGGNQSKDGFFYANALVKLFEHIAQIIDGHGGLVERHYGAGKMARVIERLQVEADRQGGIILDTWADERKVDRKLTDIRSYAYTFLVQSFLPVQKGSSGTPRSNSPAQGRISEDEGVDMKEIDALLSEMTLMLGRWSLYVRFVSDKCLTPNEEVKDTNEDTDEELVPDFLRRSNLKRKITDRVINPFNTMTMFFFRRSVEKAFQLDEQPADLSLNPHKPLNSNPPHVTSAVDDIMYIVNKVLQQSLATSQETVVSSAISTLARVMGSDFIGMVQRKMRDEYPKAAIQGALPPEHIIVAFIVLINDLDVASDYINQIITGQTQAQNPTSPSPVTTLFPSPTTSTAVHRHLTSFNTTFNTSTSTLLSEANLVLFTQVLKPRLRPILLDSFRDIDYSLTADDLAALAAENNETSHYHTSAEDHYGEDIDLVRRRFQHGWDALTRPISRLMTEKTFNALLVTVVSYLAKMLEKRIWGYYGRINELGAVRLERDVNAIVSIVVGGGTGGGLATQGGVNASVGKGSRYALKKEFSRCLGILMVCNLEEEEWEEFWKETDSSGGVGDADGVGGGYGLTREEMERARGIVRDDDEE